MIEQYIAPALSEGVASLALALGEYARSPQQHRADGADGAALLHLVTALEELKSAAAAAQARATAAFAADHRATLRAAGVSGNDLSKGMAAQVALARRDSPARGSRHLGLAEALVREMPATLTALATGQISEWRATVVVRETACLTREHRSEVDAELAALPDGLTQLGDRAVAAAACRIAYRLDPHAVTNRACRAESERRVTLRAAPDTMSLLNGLLPAAQGVAAWAALRACADTARAAGDPRSRGQVMADTLVERLTGQATASAVPVEIHLVMTDQTLLGDEPAPAELAGYGPLPAPMTRQWLRGAPTTTSVDSTTIPVDRVADADLEAAQMWVRRLYAEPETGCLTAMESTRRCFDGPLRQFVVLRDQQCRTPWCDAPIRHVDHPVRAADGGPTTVRNSQGLCEACNHAKEAPGWRTRLSGDGAVQTTTPSGQTYLSRRPPSIGRPPPTRFQAPVPAADPT